VTDEDFVGPIGNATPKYAVSNPIVRRLLERFLRRLDQAAESVGANSVLDVGCGEGVVTERLARRLVSAHVLGVDADDSRLKQEWQRRSADNLSFRTASAYELPFVDGSFELVCAIEVLEHLERPRDALAEMSRVASAALLLSVPNEPSWRISHMLAGRNLLALGNSPGHLNHWSKRAFGDLVSGYGRVERIETTFPWTLAVASVGPSRGT
jgi:2-polyprenyl-3-methyl-5-hydroxy-6-metoxy-1,4-benzoquinol methylase